MGRVRALAAAMCLAPLVVAGLQAPAAAQSTPSPTPGTGDGPGIEVPEAVPGEPLCTVNDQRLDTLSGMATLDDGSYAVVNSDREPWASPVPIVLLDEQCQLRSEIPFQQATLRPEALAYDPARQILWVGDTGVPDGGRGNGTVALWRVDLAGDRIPVIHRFVYDGEMRDAEALIVDGDGTPVIVTRDSGGVAELFRPAADLVPQNPPAEAVPLESVGEFSVPDTGTEYSGAFPPAVARMAVTGAAVHPDGERVVLRTYTDAFEFDVTDGDVIAAITEGTPRVTPLPDEPRGSAITYSSDGASFLTIQEMDQETGDPPVILRYTPTEPAPEPTATAAPAGATGDDSRSLLDRLGPRGIINLIGAFGVIGLLMVGAGVFGIVRARRNASEEDEYDDEYGYGDWDDDYGHAAPPGALPATARAAVGPPPPPYADPYGVPPPHPDPYGAPPPHADPYGAAPPPPPPVPGPPAPPGPAPQPGTVYSAGGGYPPQPPSQPYDQPYDQDQRYGYAGGGPPGQPPPRHADPGGGTYQGGTYSGGTYSAGGTYSGGGTYSAGGTYSGGGYQPAEDVPDYYYDDPDYSYEFRDRGEW